MLYNLFSGADFMPRIHCGIWTPFLLGAAVAADLCIFLAYMLISIQMTRVGVRRAKELPFKALWWFFIGFIFLCGNTHLFSGVLMFWWPAYRLATAVTALTALVSLPAAVMLCRLIPILLVMRTPQQVAAEILRVEQDHQKDLLATVASGVQELLRRNADLEDHAEEQLAIFAEMELESGRPASTRPDAGGTQKSVDGEPAGPGDSAGSNPDPSA